jgi:hypothetical protein
MELLKSPLRRLILQMPGKIIIWGGIIDETPRSPIFAVLAVNVRGPSRSSTCRFVD